MQKLLLTLGILSLFYSNIVKSELIVVTESLPGFQYYNEQGEFIGPAYDQVIEALNRSGLSYSLAINPWSVSYNAVLRDSNTCIFSIARIPSREHQFNWIASLAQFSASFYALHDSGISIDTIEDAKKHKIVVIRDNFSHHFLLKNGFNEQDHLIVIDNFDQVFNLMVQRKEMIELIVLNETQYKFKLENKVELPKLSKILPIPSLSNHLYFACNPMVDKETARLLSASFE